MGTSTSRLQIPSNGHDKRPAVAAATERAYVAMSEAAAVAQTKIVAAAGTTEKIVKAHPLKSVGVALGGGMLFGAFLAKLFTHKPTLTESFNDTLGIKRRIARAIQGWL
jgi:hypothetical protein